MIMINDLPESSTFHDHDQRLARIVKRRQARTVRERQLDVEVGTARISIVQRHTTVPNGDGKILRRVGLHDIGKQDGRHPLHSKQAHPDRCHPEDQ